jgi:N-acyl-L-homoserine lactone synthetase
LPSGRAPNRVKTHDGKSNYLITCASAQDVFAQQLASNAERSAIEELSMMQLITADCYDQFVNDLSGMHPLRPVYLIERASDGRVQGCVRLFPSSGPTMLLDAFPILLDGAAEPASSTIWESGRFALDLHTNAPKAAHGLTTTTYGVLAGMIEFGLSRQPTEIVTVTDARMVRILRHAGYRLCGQLANLTRLAMRLQLLAILRLRLKAWRALGADRTCGCLERSQQRQERLARLL